MKPIDLICEKCKHFRPEVKGCDAFENIPESIILGYDDHSKPHPKQGNNIVFERK